MIPETNINEIIFYQPDNTVKLEVRLENETVWLSLDQMATVAKFATVAIEGGRNVERMIEFFNLDVIISVGYRVKLQRGTQFSPKGKSCPKRV